MKRAARGFTLIEVLVVVSILALLAGILIVALGSVSRASKKRATVATLENCRSMLAEYELTSKLPTVSTPANTAPFTNAGFPPYYAAAFRAPALVTGDTEQYPLATPVPAVPAPPAPYPATNRKQNSALLATGQVLARLRAVPKNETAFSNFNASDLLTVSVDPASGTATRYQVPLDAWGNPVLYVHQSVFGIATGFNAGDPTVAASYSKFYEGTTANPALTAPDGKPFFASAGPDGNFFAGDDNVYSFETN